MAAKRLPSTPSTTTSDPPSPTASTAHYGEREAPARGHRDAQTAFHLLGQFLQRRLEYLVGGEVARPDGHEQGALAADQLRLRRRRLRLRLGQDARGEVKRQPQP